MESNQLNDQDPPNEDAVIELLTLTCEVDKFGTKHYYNKEGQLHRIHGPAFINAAGTTAWYKNGENHREDGPAIVYSNGEEFWYKDGDLHREDGPAVIFRDGHTEYWVNGKRLAKKGFAQWHIDNRE